MKTYTNGLHGSLVRAAALGKVWNAALLEDESIHANSQSIHANSQSFLFLGGIFRVYIKFDENYNVCPPKVCFHTIPYHPNIDMITGRPCIYYLDDAQRWNPAVRIGELLVQIQVPVVTC